nr:hypothetical protein [uncultured Methanoregula sp.]
MSSDSGELLAIADDVRALIDLWNVEAGRQFRACKDLIERYRVKTEGFDGDDAGCWIFFIDGVRYRWEYGGEQLYLADDIDGDNEIQGGKVWEFATAHMAAVHATYFVVEAEMDRRGWDHDPGDFEYHLWNDAGWRFDLDYYPTSMDNAHDFEYEPDEPGYYWYRPIQEIILDACWQIKRDAGLFDFKLSDLEALS